jgi:flagellar basal-body rod protein FlgF
MAPADVTVGPAPPNTRVVQGAIEKSNVKPILEMARMIEITRSYSDIAAILQQQGDLRRNSLQQLSQPPSSSS